MYTPPGLPDHIKFEDSEDPKDEYQKILKIFVHDTLVHTMQDSYPPPGHKQEMFWMDRQQKAVRWLQDNGHL